ncbi:hypothetical protein BKA67DRAFT_540597 [Truncatella angustata]|uniref:EthD domain-containing protein n=1 Tax=Truncatella angustata TaxID=152316 RepID=A0A9P8RJU9_9PEZI|nr:uncharacterized protein BKA67DRAFT_540597 [Truncatella angustata]KAH6647144.1 hypothetical protein BKA67DRAFT_540597 [Truncatella angustata]KAH8194428.1 hypothetical protein TruAng_011411 [Truncatella angustata]
MAPVVLNIAYPAGSSFNKDYYLNTHMLLAVDAWKDIGGLVDWKLLTALGDNSPYDAVLQVTWESAEALGKMRSQTSPEKQKELADDLPNYSTKAPSVWVLEVQGGS